MRDADGKTHLDVQTPARVWLRLSADSSRAHGPGLKLRLLSDAHPAAVEAAAAAAKAQDAVTRRQRGQAVSKGGGSKGASPARPAATKDIAAGGGGGGGGDEDAAFPWLAGVANESPGRVPAPAVGTADTAHQRGMQRSALAAAAAAPVAAGRGRGGTAGIAASPGSGSGGGGTGSIAAAVAQALRSAEREGGGGCQTTAVPLACDTRPTQLEHSELWAVQVCSYMPSSQFLSSARCLLHASAFLSQVTFSRTTGAPGICEWTSCTCCGRSTALCMHAGQVQPVRRGARSRLRARP